MLIERGLFRQVQRHIASPEAVIVTGMRRTGKTSLLRFIYERIPSTNKIFLDLENPLNQKYFSQASYGNVKSSLEFLGLDFTKKPYLFLDEIQLVKNLPSVMKYLIDHYALKCFLTGSASFYLKNLFTESMAGRKFIFELFPLDFAEFLRFKGSKIKIPPQGTKITKPIFDTLSPLYEEYIRFGGFPEVVLKTRTEEKRKSLEDIFTAYFQLEVLRLGDFRKNEVIRDLILLLMERVGSKLDINKLSSELGISRITLNDYIAFLEGTYFLSLVRPFCKNRDTEIRKMPKVYICDSGLAHHFSRTSSGSLFENSVFQNLKMRGEVNYYQRKGGAEVDFILDKKIGIEVKTNPTRGDLVRLERICKEIGLKKFRIIGKTYNPKVAGDKNVEFGFGGLV